MYLKQRVEALCLFPVLQLLCAALDLRLVCGRGGAQDMEENSLGQRIGLAGDFDLEAGAHRVLLFVVFMYICIH